jgi:hypothetical protein
MSIRSIGKGVEMTGGVKPECSVRSCVHACESGPLPQLRETAGWLIQIRMGVHALKQNTYARRCCATI